MSGPLDVRPFRIDVTHGDGEVVLRLAGELDIAGAPLFEYELDAAERAIDGALVLDASELEFVDSTGIRLIFEASERAKQAGRTLSIRGMQPPVRRTFELVGLLDALPVEQ